MPKKLTIEDFIEQAIEVHGNRYDYSKTVYTGTHNKIEVICSIHGSFFPTPNSHISKQSGCMKCSGKEKRNTQDLIDFIQHHVKNQELDFSLTEYKNRHTPIKIICKKHGTFKKLPNEIFNHKSGCSRCEVIFRNQKRTIGTEEFIKRAKQIHGDKYLYHNVVCERMDQKVKITCSTHGEFLQTPVAHISNKQGCRMCGRERSKSSGGGYSVSYFEKYPERKSIPGMFYAIHMTHHTDDFIKIGITKRKIYERYGRVGEGKKYLARDVLITKYMSLFDAYTLEQQLLTKLQPYKYWPNYVFDGRTECFKNTPEVLESIEKALNM